MKCTPSITFNILNIVGLSLMFVSWLQVANTEGFLLLLFLAIMCIARIKFTHRHVPKTIFLDLLMVMVAFFTTGSPITVYALAFVLFQGMFWGLYPVATVIVYFFFQVELSSLLLIISVTGMGVLLNFWQQERKNRLEQRDYFSKKTYELETLQSDLTNALNQVEQMSIVAERSRISSEIHDNAGHEIVASYISLQTVGKIIEENPEKAAELFHKSMARLDAGVKKMRDAVHNMSAVTLMGVEKMREICENSPKIPVTFTTSGDMAGVTTNMWHVLEATLNESLTNAMKHSEATYIRVEMDGTKHLVRLLIENDGIVEDSKPTGAGLRNLRHRVTTVGGNLTVTKDETFRVVCIIPIK